MPIEIGSAVRIKATGQNGRVIGLKSAMATVRLSLDKNVPSVDWISVATDEVELLEMPGPSSQEPPRP